MKPIGPILVTLALAGCAAHVPEAERMSRAGDWEGALASYQLAATRHPGDASIAKKIDDATAQLIRLDLARGWDADQAGRVADAGAWWRKAIELCNPRVQPEACGQAREAIDHNQTALEYAGDDALTNERFEEALGAYGAVLVIHPDSPVADKLAAAQRGFASALEAQADGLAKDGMLGAALVVDLRALSHDPMQSKAFRSGSKLKAALRSHLKVKVADLAVDSQGHRSFGQAVRSAIAPHLDDVEPYGPTKDPAAVRAFFGATIVNLSQYETSVTGVDKVANDDLTPVSNPAHEAAQADVDAAAKKLSELRHASKPDPKAIARARADWKMRKAAIAKIPPTMRPPRTFDLPWTETTRTVEATVRFELREADFVEPITLELTHRASQTDRSHPADRRHHVDADPLSLPSYADLSRELSTQFADGAAVIETARARRVEQRLAEGREQLASSHDEEALEAFVQVLFLGGPQALPPDATAFVARSMEREGCADLVAAN